jgi:hypothetical protein
LNRRLLIFIGGSDEQNGDYSRVNRMARRGGTANWSSLRDAQPGDRVLIYIQRPHSALIAEAKVLAEAKKTEPEHRYPYRARIGRFKLLSNPLDIDALKNAFPRWAWLRYPRSKAIVPPRYADRLWNLVHEKTSVVQIPVDCAIQLVGGGFGDAKTNKLIEKAAIRNVTQLLKRRGFRVRSRENERVGYDLDATKGRTDLHVEVKGVAGQGMQFLITQAEVAKAASDRAFRLMVVTEARTRSARVQEFQGQDLKRRFALTPVAYFAAMN